MRVLIAGLWGATEPSGICRTVVNLVRGLNDTAPQVQISVVMGRWQHEYFRSSFGSGDLAAHLVSVDIQNRPIARNWWYLAALPTLSRKLKADLVHLSYPAPIARRRFVCPVITTLHDLYPYDCPENFGYPRVLLNRAALWSALSASDRIACVSEFTLTRLHRYFPASIARKGIRIHNSVAVSRGEFCRQSLVNGPYLLAVAQHRANKNLDLLLRSFHLYRAYSDSPRGVKLVIVGMEGPETARLRRLIGELALEDSVKLLSNIPDGELAALYKGCEMFVTLSRIEGFGLPLGEALASGAKVVASDIPAHRIVAGASCEYVSLGGVDEAARTAETFRRVHLKPRLLHSTPNASSITDVARQYLNLYCTTMLTEGAQSEGEPAIPVEERG